VNIKYTGKIIKYLRLIFLIGIFGLLLSPQLKAATPVIEVLTVKGSVNPVLSDYITHGIERAENENAIACIIQLDTPGGLDSSMRNIIQKMVSAKVPVIVYVAPSGARAASAGTFITIAAHVAAMAPGTSIGAAHPISIGIGDTSNSVEDTKVLNDSVAYIRSLAQSHGRNADWAEQAVRNSVTATDQEALLLNIVDIVASDLDTLIFELDGRQINMLDGTTLTLHTGQAAIHYTSMNWVEDFLYAIVDPNIAYILLTIAALGIFAEIFNPGLIFPGIIGVICGLLAFYSFGMLPVNLTGIIFILLALGLFVAEVLTPGFGLLFTGGLISFIFGSLILFEGGGPGMQLSPWLIAIVVIIIAGFFGFIIERVVRIHRRRATTGKEDMIGKIVIARTNLSPSGQVFFKGERWEAISLSGKVESGDSVIIDRADGLVLYVKRVENDKEVVSK
jgi:membrane-bound serine protease (ClpP class)